MSGTGAAALCSAAAPLPLAVTRAGARNGAVKSARRGAVKSVVRAAGNGNGINGPDQESRQQQRDTQCSALGSGGPRVSSAATAATPPAPDPAAAVVAVVAATMVEPAKEWLTTASGYVMQRPKPKLGANAKQAHSRSKKATPAAPVAPEAVTLVNGSVRLWVTTDGRASHGVPFAALAAVCVCVCVCIEMPHSLPIFSSTRAVAAVYECLCVFKCV